MSNKTRRVIGLGIWIAFLCWVWPWSQSKGATPTVIASVLVVLSLILLTICFTLARPNKLGRSERKGLGPIPRDDQGDSSEL